MASLKSTNLSEDECWECGEISRHVAGIINFINAHVHTTIMTPQLNAFEIIGRSILDTYSEAELGVISKTESLARNHANNVDSERVRSYGSFEEGFQSFLEGNLKCSVLFFTDCSYSVESKKHLFMFIRAYQIQMLTGEVLPRLVFMYKNANHPSDKEHVLYFAPKTNLTVFFNNKFSEIEERSIMLNKIGQIGKSYIKGETDKVCVIVPYSNYFQHPEVLEKDILKNENFVFLSEDEAFMVGINIKALQDFVVVIDTCMRRISYASLGGGIRFMDGIVGSNYLEDVEAILRTYQEIFDKTLPLYRMIDMETFQKLRVYAKPYVTQYAKLFKSEEIPFAEIIQNPEPIFYDVEKFSNVKQKDVWDKRNEVVGPLSNAFIAKWEEIFGNESKMTALMFASAFDCLTLDILEYENDFESSDKDTNLGDSNDRFKLQFFKEHFEAFRGKDSVEIFANVWNAYVEDENDLDFADWVDQNYLQYNKMMEFYNTYSTLTYGYTKKSLQKIKISEESMERCRKIFRVLRENEVCKVSEERVSVYSLQCERDEYKDTGLPGAEGKEIKIFKTLLFEPIDPDVHVYPILYDEKGYVLSFFLHSCKKG